MLGAEQGLLSLGLAAPRPRPRYRWPLLQHLMFVARHGETAWNLAGRWQGQTDIPLSDAGRAQARALGAALAGRGIVAVHASDLQRATETAEIVAGMLGITALNVDARLRERGFGCFEGLSREECAARHPEAWARYLADRRATPPGGEPQLEVATRVVAALTEIARAPRAADEATLVISHGGTIRTFIHEVTGAAPPPLENGALFVARYAGQRFVSVTRAE
jgi:broad specificity phosphatase PhoE